MDCWQILGIEPTDDERAIKRAYAKQLKTTRPDDDAAAYQRLREAFDYALAVAPHICIDADGDEDEDADGDIWPSENHGQPETGQTGCSDGTSAIPPAWENGSNGNGDEETVERPSESPFDGTSAASDTDKAFSDGRDIHSPEYLLSKLEQWFNEAGSEGLLHRLGEFRASLDGMSWDEGEQMSRYCLDFLHKHDITHPLLWSEWSDTFGWPHESAADTDEGFSDGPYAAILPEELETRLEAWFEQGGCNSLLEHREQIFAMLGQMPLGGSEEASYMCAAFLRRHDIYDRPLWIEWSDYFGWHEDKHGRILTPVEMMRLQNFRENAVLSRLLARSDDETRFSAEPDPIPYTRAFDRFLGRRPGFFRQQLAGLAAVLSWPNLSSETTQEQREALALSHFSLYDLLQGGKTGYGAWIVILGLLLFTLSFAAPNQTFFGLLIAALLVSFAAGLTSALHNQSLYMSVHFPQTEKWQRLWLDFKYRPAMAVVILFVLPAATAALQFSPLHDNPDFAVIIFPLIILFSCTYYIIRLNAHKYGWLLISLSVTGLLAMSWSLNDQKLLPENGIAATYCAILLWFNAALYLLEHKPNWLAAVERPINLLLNGQASRLQQPFCALYAAAVWPLLLPAHVARTVQNGHLGTVLEIAAIGLFLMLLIPDSLHPYGFLLFYPAMMLAAWLRRYSMRGLLKLMRRYPAADGQT